MKVVQTDHRGKSVFVGIDVHLKSYVVVARGSHMNAPFTATCPADPAKLVTLLHKRFAGADLHSVYEAGFSGFGLHRVLVAANFKNIVVNAASIEVAANDKTKTDKRDADKMSLHLMRGQLVGIRIPTPEEELRRQLTRTRAQLIRERSRIGNQIKAKLRYFGIALPGAAAALKDDEAAPEGQKTPPMSLAQVERIATMPLATELKTAIASLAAMYRTATTEVKKLDKEIDKQAAAEPRLEEIYQSAPGIGRISARTLANELGDMTQFRNERALFNFLGMTPSQYSSGETRRDGRITRKGAGRLRGLLDEAAWRAIREDPALEQAYKGLAMRRGGKKAIVAIARRLIGRIRACFRKDELYTMSYGQTEAMAK
jgi:transposase